MGIRVSRPYELTDIPVRAGKSNKTLKPFDPKRHGAVGDLLVEFPAYHPSLGKPPEGSSPYWWVDCQFVPFNNSQLIATAGAYTLRPGRTWTPCSGVRAGLISHWYIGQNKPSCGILKGTRSSACPKVQLHPDGKYLGFVARGCVVIVDTLNNTRYIIEDSLRPVSHKYCAFSPDGISIAVLFRVQCSFELEICSLDARLRKHGSVICSHLCESYIGTRSYTEQVECMFSPDSTRVALSHSNGTLFIAYKHNLSLHCKVFPGIVSNAMLSNERSYDFDPAFGHEILAAGGSDSHLYIIDTDMAEILYEQEFSEMESIDCIQYSKSGDFLAVALSDFSIVYFSPLKRHILFRLDMKEKCPEMTIQPATGRFPAVIRMSFDHSSEHVAVSSTDGQVRIWQLPAKLNLQYLCKLKLQQYCSVKNMKTLPLPATVINYLLSPG